MYYMCIHILNSSELTHVAAVDLGGAVYGQGSGSILEIVSCHGTERSLIDCEYYMTKMMNHSALTERMLV